MSGLRFAVIGNPVEHSLSPTIHRAFAAQTDITLSYERLLAPMGDFASTAAEFFQAGGAGLNVTVPFKVQAYEWVDERDPYAGVAGAVNTIVPVARGLRGCNTDGLGLKRDLEVNLGETLAGRRLLILGAGGVVQGILGPLLGANPREVVVANRTQVRADALVERLEDPRLRASPPQSIEPPFDVVINGTSAGLSGELPDIDPGLLGGAFVYDLVYGPAAEGFLAQARQASARAVSDGLGMLVEQAAEAFLLWHGLRPDARPVLDHLRGLSDSGSDSVDGGVDGGVADGVDGPADS